MRILNETEICGVGGAETEAEPAASVSCCRINLLGFEASLDWFSFSLPNANSNVSQQYTTMNNGVPRG